LRSHRDTPSRIAVEELDLMPVHNDPEPLDDRKATILKSVVTRYVETAQPVGSSQVAHDSVLDVSPATVRADMATLEREGFLTHPHTSAGRIPTDKGYRFFVDHLGNPQPLARAEHEQVQDFFSKAHGELERVLQDTSRLLAELTDCAAVVVSPAHQALVVRSALVVRLSAHTAMAVAVLSNGVVEKRTISVREDVPEAVLAVASAVLQQRLSGSSLGGARHEMPSGDPDVDEVVKTCLEALEDGAVAGADDQVYVGGAAFVTERFDAIEKVRAVLEILEQSFVVVTLLRDVLAQGESVSIGSEHAGIESLAECSLVVAPYESDGVALGTIGVLGPTRMDYEHALAAVAIVGQRLTRELRQG
jgi:heat-inducible transcriptional repressor